MLKPAILSGKTLTLQQLELVIQKKKIVEVQNWFQEHFVGCSHAEYSTKCPIIILQGSTGCGKTSVLKYVADDLKLDIREFCETTDTTAINYDLAKLCSEDEKDNLSNSINSRKAHKFEHFVINSLRYNTLYPHRDLDEAGSEFDSDDGYVNLPDAKPPSPPVNGVIIHIDTPLTFARSQKVLINSLLRILKAIKGISQNTLRRIAIVFETLEGEGDSICLPTKVKSSLGIQTIKFNPITKANMKKLVESYTKSYNHLLLGKDDIEQFVNDCDGDIRACINTINLMCNRPSYTQVLGRNTGDNFQSFYKLNSSIAMPTNKKQKTCHDKVRHVEVKSGLKRDEKKYSFFHLLGKIFYQKRLYPDQINNTQNYRSVERPFPTENSTEQLANKVGMGPKNLNAWLHQNYSRFCRPTDVAKASLFLENHSIVDTTSLDSLQTSQFYEIHHALDQIQTYLAIASTVYSLYEDQSNATTKSSHKKAQTNDGYKLIKTSVPSTSNELFSFVKPNTMIVSKLVDDYGSLLNSGTSRLIESTSGYLDPIKVLVDYVPYLNIMCTGWTIEKTGSRVNLDKTIPHRPAIFNDANLCKIFKTLDCFEPRDQDIDLDVRHEKLLELIEEVEYCQGMALPR